MKRDSKILLLAGLLHDIGKFFQRADEGLNDANNQLSEVSKNIADYICPKTQDGYLGYMHVIWTHEFIHRNSEKFKAVGLFDAPSIKENLITLAAYHHKPATKMQAFIQLADWWSSGLDRSSETEYATEKNWGKSRYKTIPLSPLFQNLHVNKSNYVKSKEYGYPLSELALNDDIFPRPVTEINSVPDAYKMLWQKFESQFMQISTKDSDAFIFTLLHHLKSFTRAIPASTKDYPDSSLFEHLKITGAIAQCLFEYHEAKPEAFLFNEKKCKLELKENEYPLILLCGDLSGIQSFIYQISSKGAAKSLKGRSFYVQAIAESAALHVLNSCGLSICNLVYAAGGKFYIIAPHLDYIEEKVETAFSEMEDFLWQRYEGKITINHAAIPFGYQKVSSNKSFVVTPEPGYPQIHVGVLWRLLAEKTSAQKGRKYESMLTNPQRFDALFKPFGAGGTEKVCAVTGKELTQGNYKALDTDEGEEELLVDEDVYMQVALGKALNQHDYILYSKGKLPAYNGFLRRLFGDLHVAVARRQEINSADDAFVYRTFKTNNSDASIIKGNRTGIGYRFYGGYGVAVDQQGNPFTFEELGGSGNFKRIGVLRMDVDNLSQLFMYGIPEKSRSFSALATLSAQLDLFFSGYLNTIREKEDFKNWVNIIYSGGDDVFAVGRWDKIILFAYEVRNAFRRFVCDRNDISISAGIAIVRPKFPIGKAADLAGEAEDAAKEYEYQADGVEYNKNAINLFDVSVNWDQEFPFVLRFKDDLVKWMNEEKITKGVLMKLFDYYALYKVGLPDWQWRAAYTFARLEKERKQASEVYEQLKVLLFSGAYANFRNIRFDAIIMACRWAEFENRSK